MGAASSWNCLYLLPSRRRDELLCLPAPNPRAEASRRISAARLHAQAEGLRHSRRLSAPLQTLERPLRPAVPTKAGGGFCPVNMNWMAVTCWALLLAATFLCDSGETKGGRGGARGSARGGLRGGSRGVPRARVRPAPRYSGSSLRMGAAGAAAGAAAGLAAGSAGRRVLGPWEGPGGQGLEDEDAAPEDNRTGVYSYRAWTSGAGPACGLRLCLLLGGALSALGLLQP